MNDPFESPQRLFSLLWNAQRQSMEHEFAWYVFADAEPHLAAPGVWHNPQTLGI